MVQAIREVSESGLLSASHRSAAFMEVSKRAIEGLRAKMGLPKDYHIFYQPSATVAMDTLLRNLVLKKSSHFTHGVFSKRFFDTAVEIGLQSEAFDSAWDQAVDWKNAKIPSDSELIAVTHNETSTGLMWPKKVLCDLRKRYPEPLLAIDVTSTFGALKMPWQEADIWFGSVQKCLGLPAGLGFLIVSPRAFEKSIRTEKVPSWQRLEVMAEKMKNYQTFETPNVLGIALLAKQMEEWDLVEIERQIMRKKELLDQSNLPWQPYLKAEDWRSFTVANFSVGSAASWHAKAKKAHMTLGKGYGPLKESCIRIANFPAISFEMMQRLLLQLQ